MDHIIIWDRHGKTCLWAYTDSEGPDQSAHPHSLIKPFTFRLQSHLVLYNITEYNNVPDQTIYFRLLIMICLHFPKDTISYASAHTLVMYKCICFHFYGATRKRTLNLRLCKSRSWQSRCNMDFQWPSLLEM